jgi:hypothetical protein
MEERWLYTASLVEEFSERTVGMTRPIAITEPSTAKNRVERLKNRAAFI